MSSSGEKRAWRAGVVGNRWFRKALGGLLACIGAVCSTAPALAQESAKSWIFQSVPYDSQAAAEARLRLDYPSYSYLRGIEVREGQTLYHYWRGAAPTSETLWEYKIQGKNTVYASEQDAFDALKIAYQARSNQQGCSFVTVVAGDEWAVEATNNGSSTQEKREYTATYAGCSYEPSTIDMSRSREVTCPGNLDWSATDGICGGGSTTQTIASKPLACTTGCTMVENPVDVANGEKYQPEPADIDLGWFRFARLYQSGTATGIGALSRGWSHNHAERLSLDGTTPRGHVRADGGEVGLKPFPGYWEANDGSGDRLVSEGGNWIFYSANDVSNFDARGRLTQKRFDDGTSLTYAYDNADRLLSITHSTGRKATFEYVDPNLSIEPRISAILVDGQVLASYAYTTGGMLDVVTFPDTTTRQYHYEDGRFPWHLTGVSIAGARYSTYAYDARGRVVTSSYAGGVGARSFAWQSNGGAVVTDPHGRTTTYGITADSADTPYRQLASTAYDSKTEARTYYDTSVDFRRRLKESVDRNGIVTRYEYAEALDAPSSEQALIRTIREAYGTGKQRDSEIRTSRTTNRVLMARTGNREIRIQRNGRLQPVFVQVKDTTTSETRTTALEYCEQADVDGGLCPSVGLLRKVLGPRTGVSDDTTFLYRTADDPACADGVTPCGWRKGDLWKTVDARLHATEILRYDGAGRVLSVRDANGVVTDTEYDANGRVTASKRRGTDDGSEADDRISRLEYWPDGSVKKIVQPDGAYVLFGYDAAHRLTDIVDGDGNAIHYTLDNAGQRTKEETFDAGGGLRRTLERSFDTLGRIHQVREAAAQARNASTGAYLHPATMTYAYDDVGNLSQVDDALGRRTTYQYDALDRLEHSLQNATADSTALDRSSIGLQLDALDRVTQVGDPNGLDTHYAYNAFGDRTQLQSPDTGVANAIHDAAGNVIQYTDAAGRVRTAIYDELNRITDVDYLQDSSLDETYTYDTPQADCQTGETFLVGRLSKMQDGSGDTTFCYNRYGDLVRKVQRAEGQAFTLSWQYLPNGRLASMTYPDGSRVEYQYDAQGRIAALERVRANNRQTLLTSASYAPFGPVQSWVYGNGLAYRRTLNADYRPGVVEDGPVNGVGPGISLGYEFDAIGNLWKLRDGKQAEPPLRVYAYDGLDRLTAARDAAGTDQQTYAYDRTGNRTASGYWQVTGTADCSGVPPGDPCTPGAPVSAWKTRTYDYVPQKHHLWTIGYTERHYDATGNTIWIGPKSVEQPPGDGDPGPGDPGGGETESAAYAGTEQSMIGLDDGTEPPPGIVEKTFVYNAANRMASVSDAGVLAMSYRYNGAGERVYRTGSGKTVHTVFDPAGHWIGDYDGYGQPLQQAIWLGDLPVGLVARIDGLDRLFYVEPDALGSPRVVIDPTRDIANGGMAVWRWPLMGDAFGEEAPYEDPDGDGTAFVLDLRFPGQQYDSATGFNYNYFRDYDATTGRYAQSDQIGLRGGISTYGYVAGNPMRWTDRLGLEVDINLFYPGLLGLFFGDPLYASAQRVQNRPDEISVGGHGRASAVLDYDMNPIPVDKLADLIRNSDKWKNGVRRVRLYSCEVGRKSLRFDLAKALGPGAEVIAPSTLVWYSPSGGQPTVNGAKEVNGKYVRDLSRPGYWYWATTEGSGLCVTGCY